MRYYEKFLDVPDDVTITTLKSLEGTFNHQITGWSDDTTGTLTIEVQIDKDAPFMEIDLDINLASERTVLFNAYIVAIKVIPGITVGQPYNLVFKGGTV